MARQIQLAGNAEGQNSQNPYWILVTFPYLTNDTFDRGRIDSPPQAGFRVVSRDEDENNSRKTGVFLFDSEIRSWNVSQSKGNHIHNLSLQMFNPDGTLALLEWMSAGDWCMFWTFSDRKSYETVRRRLVKSHDAIPWTSAGADSDRTDDTGPVVNNWQSGLKFIGRLQAPRATEYRHADGSFDVGYAVQAHGFTELESTIYYDDVIRFKYPRATEFFQDLGISLEKFLVTEDGPNHGYVNTNVAIPALTQILLGQGPGVLSKNKGNQEMGPSRERASIEDSPNVQFEIPEAVAKILDFQTRSEENRSRDYSDVLTQIIGDQTYGGTPKDTDPRILLPEVSVDNAAIAQIFYTKNPLVDYFPPDPLDFKNHSVWSILKNYTNEPINEIYTALRPHPISGNLSPTLIVRRSPYSSATYQDRGDALKALPFNKLPRWIIPTSLMYGYDIGKTDSARINYVHVTPSTFPSANQMVNEQLVRLQAPPVVNKVDIMRHGLRTFITRVAGFANPTTETTEANTSRKYTEFMADILMDAHLRYNGTLTTVGIQEPIQPGDNLVFNGILFHIEAVSHSGGIAGDGTKSFQSSFSLSHGISMKVVKDGGFDAIVDDFGETKKAGKASPKAGVAKSKSKHKMSAKQAQAQRDAETKKEKERIAEELRKYKEPPENEIRKLRNERTELQLNTLIGAKTHSEGGVS